MTEQYIRDRISSLRRQKRISEYRMSLDLGHSKGYIQSISSGRAMPSMGEFLAICDYLEVTPGDFFDEGLDKPVLYNELCEEARDMSADNLELLISLGKRLT